MRAFDDLSMRLAETTGTAAASQRLGVTAETVRRHLRRGTLDGIKVMSRWRVLLGGVPQRAIVLPPQPQMEAVDTAGAVIHVLMEDVAYLREQLSDANREREELRRLLAQAQAIMSRLIAGAPGLAPAAVVQEALPSSPPAAAAPEPAHPDPPAKPDAKRDALSELLKQRAAQEPLSAPQDGAAAPQSTPLEAMITRYLALGWHLRIKLDHRAELAAPTGGQLLYLEEQPDGTVTRQQFREPS